MQRWHYNFIVYALGVMSLCYARVPNSLNAQTPFKLGLENIPSSLIAQLKHKRIGLITNQTGVDQQGRTTLEVLRSYGLSIQVLLTPEHGLTGRVQAEHDVANSVDQRSGLSVISLYSNGKGKIIQEDVVGDLDALIFDIQDSGMRHYTYISTLFEVLKAAATYNKQLIVLDRPNPLGLVMEGPLVEPELQSFISIAPIPLRHGMTVGELAGFFNVHLLEKPAPLYVVPMRNYQRHHTTLLADALILSPNITSKAACYGYSFLGLLGEVRPFHTCIGTDKALQCIMLPEHMASDVPWRKVQELLRTHQVNSELYAYTHEKTGKSYKGLHVTIADINTVSSWRVLVTLLQFFNTAGVPLNFSPSFDKAVGTCTLQKMIKGGKACQLYPVLNTQLQQFYARARASFMYLPHPNLFLHEV